MVQILETSDRPIGVQSRFNWGPIMIKVQPGSYQVQVRVKLGFSQVLMKFWTWSSQGQNRVNSESSESKLLKEVRVNP